MMPELPRPLAGTDAGDARFWPIEDLHSNDGHPLAFDHQRQRIVADGIERARSKLEYTSLATAFVEEPFTIADLRRVYEVVWGVPLHPANFRRKVLSTPGLVVATGDERATGRGWAELYRRGDGNVCTPPCSGPTRQNQLAGHPRPSASS
jgi:8-oxo-dGTP diphosphatase